MRQKRLRLSWISPLTRAARIGIRDGSCFSDRFRLNALCGARTMCLRSFRDSARICGVPSAVRRRGDGFGQLHRPPAAAGRGTVVSFLVGFVWMCADFSGAEYALVFGEIRPSVRWGGAGTISNAEVSCPSPFGESRKWCVRAIPHPTSLALAQRMEFGKNRNIYPRLRRGREAQLPEAFSMSAHQHKSSAKTATSVRGQRPREGGETARSSRQNRRTAE